MRSFVHKNESKRAFTIVELLVVIGVIAILLGILMPSLSKARVVAKSVACRSNLRQAGQALLIYSNTNRGVLCPLGEENMPLGGNVSANERWTKLVFGTWNPKVLLCPASVDPVYDHSYVLNFQLVEQGFTKFVSRVNGRSSSEVILMGEKYDSMLDYFVRTPTPERDTYKDVVEERKHKVRFGSSGLFLDGHVDGLPTKKRDGTANPWDPAPTVETP